MCHGIFADRSIFRFLFPSEKKAQPRSQGLSFLPPLSLSGDREERPWERGLKKAVPVRWRNGDKLVSCHWALGSHRSLIRGKFNLKINRSVKTTWRKYRAVVRSYSWVPHGGRVVHLAQKTIGSTTLYSQQEGPTLHPNGGHFVILRERNGGLRSGSWIF